MPPAHLLAAQLRPRLGYGGPAILWSGDSPTMIMAASEARALQHRLCGFGLLLVFVGGAGIGGLQIAKRRIAQTSQWPSTSGKIVTSEVATGAVKNGRVLIVSPHAKTDYSYTVNGKSYRGEQRRVVPMLHFDTEGTPEQVVAKYPVGKSVTVYYDPNNPADALLARVPEPSAQSLIDALTLIAPVVAGIGLLIAGLAGVNLWRTRGLMPKVSIMATSMAPVVLPTIAPARQLLESPARTPSPTKPPRKTHWLIRGAATLLGLGLFLFGTLVAVTIPRINPAQINGTTSIVMMAIFAGVILFGAFLIWVGMRQPRVSVSAT